MSINIWKYYNKYYFFSYFIINIYKSERNWDFKLNDFKFWLELWILGLWVNMELCYLNIYDEDY